MKDNVSPEEKLLRLIRKQKEGAASAEPKKPAPPALAPSRPTVASPSPQQKKKASFRLPDFTLTPTNGLFILLGACCLYLLFSLITLIILPRKVALPEIAAVNQQAGFEDLINKTKSLDEYLLNAQNRRMFGKAETAETLKPALLVGSDQLKDIALVGIITGESPQAVIEDRKAFKTFYVSPGQYINEFQVQEIKEGKIILNFKGQMFELYL